MWTSWNDSPRELAQRTQCGGPDTPAWRTAEEMEAARTAKQYQELLKANEPEPPPADATPKTCYCARIMPPYEHEGKMITSGHTIACRSRRAAEAVQRLNNPPADAPKPVNFKEFL